MPFHLGDHPALPVPRSGLIAEAGVETAHMVGWASNRTTEQMADAFQKNLVLRQTDRVQEALVFQKRPDTSFRPLRAQASTTSPMRAWA